MQRTKWTLPIIVLAQFCCISLWFAGNGVMENLIESYALSSQSIGSLTSAVQLGFITGTLLYAFLTLADRYPPSRVFFLSALLAAGFNMCLIWEGNTFFSLLASRFMTGFFLAGIYPVGMKIAADHFEKGLGRSLSFLVGALVLGTAFPHLLKGSVIMASWQGVIWVTSGLSLLGGLLIFLFVPNGPYRLPGRPLKVGAIFIVFKNREFRGAALGYFGHMWELYAFWAFVPVMLHTYGAMHSNVQIPISYWSFLIIGSGSLACVLGGYISQVIGVQKTAFRALLLSGLCCLLSPLAFLLDAEAIFLSFLLFWGMVVIADSPLFSTMVANNAEGQLKGSALTLVNCIGFAITIISIQLLSYLQNLTNPAYLYTVLALGPIIGLVALRKTISNPS